MAQVWSIRRDGARRWHLSSTMLRTFCGRGLFVGDMVEAWDGSYPARLCTGCRRLAELAGAHGAQQSGQEGQP